MTRRNYKYNMSVGIRHNYIDRKEVNQMNSRLLKATIVKNGDTQEKLAEAMGLQTSGLNMRINGHTEFRRNEINFIKNRYGLTSDEIDSIFFTELVS